MGKNTEEEWQRFERIVGNYLSERYGFGTGVEEKPQIEGSIPDFEVGPIWLFWNDVVDAKHKENVSRGDMDKLIRDREVHEATGAQLFISSQTNISDELVDYADENNIQVHRLGWNGQIIGSSED